MGCGCGAKKNLNVARERKVEKKAEIKRKEPVNNTERKNRMVKIKAINKSLSKKNN